MRASHFINAMMGCVVLAAALVASLNVIVDPYLIFDRPRAPGFNAIKPAVETHEPMMKAYQATRVTPKTVILGSSRSDIGLDPASPAWPAAMRPVYNLSVVGSGLSTNLRYLRSLLSSRASGSRPQTLIVALDFEAFLHRPTAAVPNASKEEAPQSEDEQTERLIALERQRDWTLPPSRIVKDYVAATLTLDALLDSLSTLAANRGSGGPDLEASGRLSHWRLQQWTESDGAAQLFAQKNQLTVRQYLKPKQVLSETPDSPIRDFAELDALIDLARGGRMTVVLAVQPAHVSRLELLDGMGYWPDYERWKRGLTKVASDARASGVDVTVWDFGGYEPFMREDVPTAGDRSRVMKWFWDPVHYSVQLGDAMISAMTDQHSSLTATALLTSASVERRLSQIRHDRSEFRREAPAQLVEVRRTLCAAGRCASQEPEP